MASRLSGWRAVSRLPLLLLLALGGCFTVVDLAPPDARSIDAGDDDDGGVLSDAGPPDAGFVSPDAEAPDAGP